MAYQLICDECRFCRIFQGVYSSMSINHPILQNEKYMVLASVGAFLEGWILVIPRKHDFSMRNHYLDADFVSITNEIIKRINEVYGNRCIIFEHGANHEGSVTSCGTNHAHLHILPYQGSILGEMQKSGYLWEECHIDNIDSEVGKGEYWFYAEDVTDIRRTKGYIHKIRKTESQFFRKLLAREEGCEDHFDYKKYDFMEISEKTFWSLVR